VNVVGTEVDAKADVGARHDRIPITAAGNANLIAFENFMMV
jgi:hypothetical protein